MLDTNGHIVLRERHGHPEGLRQWRESLTVREAARLAALGLGGKDPVQENTGDVARRRTLKRGAAGTQTGRRLRQKNQNGDHLSRGVVDDGGAEENVELSPEGMAMSSERVVPSPKRVAPLHGVHGESDGLDLQWTNTVNNVDLLEDLLGHPEQVAGPSNLKALPYDPTNVFSSSYYPHPPSELSWNGSTQGTFDFLGTQTDG